jgi:hypothetical protein
VVGLPFKRTLLKRVAHGSPALGLLVAVELAVTARGQLAKLDSEQRHRLLALVRQARGRPSSLDDGEREELRALLAALEPRLFIGSAAKRLSPLPIPKRVLYGPRGSATRVAARRRP